MAGVLRNDRDVEGDPLSAVLVTNPANGTLTLNTDGSFTYTPNANFNGADSFTYRASDGVAQSNAATVSITVAPVNDAPVARNDTAVTDEDVALTIPAADLLANDTDVDGDSLTITGVGKPINGTVTLVDGNPVFTPAADFNGTGTFSYTISDGHGRTDSAGVSVTVNAVNDAPVANAETYSVLYNNILEVAAPGVLANDTDVDDSPRSLKAELTKGGEPAHGVLKLNEDGSFDYKPALEYTGLDAFIYQAVDPHGANSKATVTINVTKKLLMNASEAPAEESDAGNALTDEELQGIVAEAVARWSEAVVLDESAQEQLSEVTFQIVDLSDLALGQATPEVVLIDVNAAGYGWYVDSTPADDLEFGLKLSELELMATDTSPAFGRMDLLTVVMHELGHVLGFEDIDPNAGALMSGTLDASTRRLNDSTPDDSPKLVQMDSVPGGGVSSLLWGAKDSKASWLEDFLVDLTGKKDNPFDPTGKIKISIPGNNGGGNKKGL
jgi:VCBS repeat-containing protein